MRLACLVRTRPHHMYFVNRVHKRHPLSLIVVERRPVRARLPRMLRNGGHRELWRIFANRYVFQRKKRALLFSRFGADWTGLPEDVPQLIVEDVNDVAVRERLVALRPDVLLDHGTSIVRGPVVSTASLALNLHWGLSPYYRGVRCTEWALINCDPYNVGVTIHCMTDRIDGGGIIAQRRVTVAAKDDIESINHRLTVAGTALLIEILDRIRAGGQLVVHKQQGGCGFLYLKKHFTPGLQREIDHVLRAGRIAAMLEAPARRERLPIVDLQTAVTAVNSI